MSERLVGKPSPRRLAALLQGKFGAPTDNLLVGPGPGLDAAVLQLVDGRVMAVAEDPIFPAPKLPLDILGWFTVHIGASDVAVTGVRPQYMTYTLLLPGSSPESDARTIIDAVSDAAAALDIAILGGHTGWYDAVTVPTIGGVTVWGFAPGDAWVSPAGARDGDVLLLTKGPAIEAAALLGVLYRDKLEGVLSDDVLDACCGRTNQITVVEDALTAFDVGGVHAMHDATEGGVLGGLWEMATAAGVQVMANLDAVAMPDDIAALSEALEFDPWKAISEGTLLAAVDPGAVNDIMAAWDELDIPSVPMGRFHADEEASTYRRDGAEFPLSEPGKDPFWDLFFAGLAE